MFRTNNTIDELEPLPMRSIRATCPINLQKMQLSYSECQILRFLLTVVKANKVLELGTLVGTSTAWIASSLQGEKPSVISIDKSKDHYEIARKNMQLHGLDHIVHLINDDALSALRRYEESGEVHFDAIFIDAKKTDYPEYLKLSKKLLRSGGLIVADNTLMINCEVVEISNALKEFNQIVQNDEDLISALLPTTSGMTVIIKK